MSNTAAAQVLMNIRTNQGYAPDQIDRTVTLADLKAALEEAIEEFGEEAQVVVFGGKSYGADYGSIDSYADIFTSAKEEEEGECVQCGFTAETEGELFAHYEATGH